MAHCRRCWWWLRIYRWNEITSGGRSLANPRCVYRIAWWRHQMETFSALLAICARNSQAAGEFPAQRPVTRSFDVFFDLRLYKRLSKQSQGWWFETPYHLIWRHCNGELPNNTVRLWLLCDVYYNSTYCGIGFIMQMSSLPNFVDISQVSFR